MEISKIHNLEKMGLNLEVKKTQRSNHKNDVEQQDEFDKNKIKEISQDITYFKYIFYESYVYNQLFNISTFLYFDKKVFLERYHATRKQINNLVLFRRKISNINNMTNIKNNKNINNIKNNNSIHTVDYDIKNLVFEGGGAKGMAYVGVQESLQKLNIYKHINNYAGSSAGAITASLLYQGVDHNLLKGILSNLDASK